MVGLHMEGRRQVFDRIGVVIPTDKKEPGGLVQGIQEPVQEPGKLPGAEHGLYRVRGGQTAFQLIQCRIVMAVALAGGVGMIAGNGLVAQDAAQVGGQRSWLLGRDGVPASQKRVVDAFLGVFPAAQNVPGDLLAETAVFLRQLLNGQLRTLEEQGNDLVVIHGVTSFRLHKYTMDSRENLTAFFIKTIFLHLQGQSCPRPTAGG